MSCWPERMVLILLAWGLPLACRDSCPAGYQFYEQTCVAVATAGSSNTAGGSSGNAPSCPVAGRSSGNAGTAGSAGVAACSESAFGRCCVTVADCDCDTDYCAAYPGQAGVCTHTGCLIDPSICPDQWTCMNLATLQPGMPSICIPPS
jgi:hypothetical protein